jgi:tryptophan synthase alpha chain
LELGIPFSDPLADGPVIQQATQVALQQGMTVARCLDMVRTLRGRGITVPFILMGSYNPILAYGPVAFVRACFEVGVDGLIVPDLPPEEGAELEKACRRYRLAQVYLLAPTSSPERVRLVTERARGFVYLVSVTGVTGVREHLAPDLSAFVGRVRRVTQKPLAVGFGISTPKQAAQVAALADGVIVGSALARLAETPNGANTVKALVSGLRNVMGRNGKGSTGEETEGHDEAAIS